MRRNNGFRSALAIVSLSCLAGLNARAAEPGWVKHSVQSKSRFEAAGAFDVNRDGKLDLVCGDTWYEAPSWSPHPIRKVEQVGTYFNCFATLPMDVDADGDTDYVTVGYFSRNVGWVENPGSPNTQWTYHEIDQPGPSEAAVLVDLTGDGRPEVLPNTVQTVTWYELEKPGKPPVWKKHDLGKAAAGHGVGSGDVNGDGRVDVLTPKGWFEAPENPRVGTWAWHPEWELGATGIQILARDVNGDRRPDIVFGNGHSRGLFWLEQQVSASGERTWKRGVIDEALSSVHTLLWADIDGDGVAGELVSGKRVYAHEVETGDTDASVIAWYRFEPATRQWERHPVFEGVPARNAPKEGARRDAMKDFPPGTAGTGLQLTAVDLDGDGDLDLVCPGKSGLYWFENQRLRPTK
ncbi:MAG: VCBS repeat-containing protein [Isosphaeraceae bacterium]